MYTELVKTKHEKFEDEKQNLRHYVEKVRSLSKLPAEKDKY